MESVFKGDYLLLTVALALTRSEAVVMAPVKIECSARASSFVLKLANEAEKDGMVGFVFSDLPDIDATTSAGRMVLTMMASVAEFEARRISERTKEALAAAKARGVCLGGYREGAAQKASERKKMAMADAPAGVGKLSSTGKPLAPAQIGRILQRLGLSGKLLGSDQAWVAA